MINYQRTVEALAEEIIQKVEDEIPLTYPLVRGILVEELARYAKEVYRRAWNDGYDTREHQEMIWNL